MPEKKHIETRVEEIRDEVTGKLQMRVRVDEVRDHLSPKTLATKLAEALDTAAKAQADVEAFSEYANFEREEASKLRDLKFQIEHGGGAAGPLRTINPKTGKPYRMNPAETYDIDAISAELETRRARANEFRDKANKAKDVASRARKEAHALRLKLSRSE